MTDLLTVGRLSSGMRQRMDPPVTSDHAMPAAGAGGAGNGIRTAVPVATSGYADRAVTQNALVAKLTAAQPANPSTMQELTVESA